MEDQQRQLAEELLSSQSKKPSYAKELYYGLVAGEHIFPFPQVNSRQKKLEDQFLKKVKTFVDTKIDADWIDRNADIPKSVIEGLAKLGVLGMTIPKKYGGLGMSQYAYCKSAELIAMKCGSTALFLNAHQSIGLKALLLFGTDEQKKKWLIPLARGEQIAAFSLTEPNAGSDAGGVETTAVYFPKKNVYRINGKKQWTTNGSIANVLTVMAQTNVQTKNGIEKKITAFLVTPDMPGFKITNPSLEKLGMRGTKTTNLEFKNMDVPAENILGPKGGGLKVCLTVLDYGRTTFGATCTGSAKVITELAIKHAIERKQFNRSLGTFTMVKKKVAMMSALTYATDATTYLTAGLLDSGVEDIMLESAMLKVFASDSQWQILYDAMQILGGRSFFTDRPFERMMRDSRLNLIGEGSNEVMRVFIGAVGVREVGLELLDLKTFFSSPKIKYKKVISFVNKFVKRFATNNIPIKSKLFSVESRNLVMTTRKFGFALLGMIAKHKEGIVEKQLILDRLATCAMALYSMSAVISKIDYDISLGNKVVPTLKNDIESAKLYCNYAINQVEENLFGLKNNNDKMIEKVSDSITGLKKI